VCNVRVNKLRYIWRDNIMYVLKLKGDLVWQTAGPDKSEDPLEFELEALLSKRATPLLVYGEVHRRIKRTLNVEQLDAFTFAKCLEEFAAEIRKAAESYE
jgi:UDP-N-acetylmuramoylalanine-D-glutamate ligase